MKSKHATITLTGITHSWGPKDLFENVDIDIIWDQVVWLIWPNGAWKSTLMSIMAWIVDPRSWVVEKEWDLVFVTQWLDVDLSLTVYEYIVSENTSHVQPEDREVMIALWKSWGKEIDVHQPLNTLSGWQQTKVRIAKCLLDDVDILLLDEPTNHLDYAWVMALQEVIRKFRGPVVIVSHDRQFLDDVCTDIFDLRWGEIEMYEGNYTAYTKERKIRAKQQMLEREEQEEKRIKAEKRLENMRHRASFYDSPSRGRLIRGRQSLYDRMFVKWKIEKVREETQMGMKVSGGSESDTELLTILPGYVTRSKTGEPLLLWSLSNEFWTLYHIPEQLTVWAMDRIVIVWENWSGKTTLLDVLKESCVWEKLWSPVDINHNHIQWWEELRIGWFSQEDESLMVDERVMKWCLNTFPAGRDQQMITEKLGNANIPEEDLVKRMSELSYGQRVKIRFLQLILHSYDLLILDEPTNHLDIATREELELMLQKYEWGILLVSHDRRFVKQIGIVSKRRIRDGEMTMLPWKQKYSMKGK